MDHLFIIQSKMDLSTLKESIDLVLATAVFSENIGIIFKQDAVLLLEAPKEASEISETQKMLSAFELYGISPLYADQSDCIRRYLKPQDCIIDVEFITGSDQQSLIDSAKKVTPLT